MILNAIARGDALVQGLSGSDDVISTMRCLQAMGVNIEPAGAAGSYTVKGQGAQLTEPSDILDAGNSGTSMRLLSGILASQPFVSVITGDGSLRSRPMQRIVDPLKQMGAGDSLQLLDQRTEGGEPLADILVTSTELHGVEIGGDLIPRLLDEVPVLAVAACFATGDTVIRDAAELRVKESDRIATTVSELTLLGASIEATGDGMVIHGKGSGPDVLNGADCESHDDHRLAMAMAVAGLLAEGETTVHGAADASVSYPEFWQDLELLLQDVR